MATKSWILLAVACLLSDVIGKCIGVNYETKCCSEVPQTPWAFAEFDAGKEHNIVIQ